MKNIVILGGGYGGLKIANQLIEKGIPEGYHVYLVDRNSYHSMKTEFYALASGTVSDLDVRMEFPKHDKFSVICDSITKIDLTNSKILLLQNVELSYYQLIIGVGSVDNYHDTKGAKEFSYSVQTIRNTRKTYEAVQNIRHGGVVTIVGAGLTGVEVASELRESRKDIHIRLLDRGNTILPSMPVRLQEYITKWFTEHNVEIIHNSHVDSVENGAVCNNGKCLLTDITIWAAGIQPNALVRELVIPKDHYGRILIDEYNRIPTFPNVFVVGDVASLPCPPSAQAAKAQGKQIAQTLFEIMHNKELKKPGKLKVKGSLGSLGKTEGFGVTFDVPLTGLIPRLMKSGVLWIHKFNK